MNFYELFQTTPGSFLKSPADNGFVNFAAHNFGQGRTQTSIHSPQQQMFIKNLELNRSSKYLSLPATTKIDQ